MCYDMIWYSSCDEDCKTELGTKIGWTQGSTETDANEEDGLVWNSIDIDIF